MVSTAEQQVDGTKHCRGFNKSLLSRTKVALRPFLCLFLRRTLWVLSALLLTFTHYFSQGYIIYQVQSQLQRNLLVEQLRSEWLPCRLGLLASCSQTYRWSGSVEARQEDAEATGTACAWTTRPSHSNSNSTRSVSALIARTGCGRVRPSPRQSPCRLSIDHFLIMS